MTRPAGSHLALFALFAVAGSAHLLRPAPFDAIMPGWVPYPRAATLISGVAEIAGGVGLLFQATRRAASWGLLGLLLAVFPANLNMALSPERYGLPPWALWARLPLQPLLMGWVWRTGQDRKRPTLPAQAQPDPRS
ncbi:MAG: DoxX family protein [Deinococcus sp.]